MRVLSSLARFLTLVVLNNEASLKSFLNAWEMKLTCVLAKKSSLAVDNSLKNSWSIAFAIANDVLWNFLRVNLLLHCVLALKFLAPVKIPPNELELRCVYFAFHDSVDWVWRPVLAKMLQKPQVILAKVQRKKLVEESFEAKSKGIVENLLWNQRLILITKHVVVDISRRDFCETVKYKTCSSFSHTDSNYSVVFHPHIKDSSFLQNLIQTSRKLDLSLKATLKKSCPHYWILSRLIIAIFNFGIQFQNPTRRRDLSAKSFVVVPKTWEIGILTPLLL